MKRKANIVIVGLVILGMLVTTIPVGFAEKGGEGHIDLICEDIISIRSEIDSDYFHVGVKIKNQGTQHAQGGFDVGYWTEVRPQSGGFGVLSRVATKQVILDLDPDESRWIWKFGIYWSQPYPYDDKMRFWGEVDCFGEVTEENENNNWIADDIWYT